MARTARIVSVVLLIIVLIIIGIIFGLSKFKGSFLNLFKPKVETSYEEVDMNKVRYPNLSRMKVEVGSSILELKNNDIYLDDTPLGIQLDLSYKPNSLNVLGNYAYVQTKLGLVRISLEDPNIYHSLFYDVWDFVAVGMDRLFVFRDVTRYLVDKFGVPEVTEFQSSSVIYEQYDDMLIFTDKNSSNLVFISMVDSVNIQSKKVPFEGNIQAYTIEDGKFVLKTNMESIDINLKEMSDELRGMVTVKIEQIEQPVITLAPKPIEKDTHARVDTGRGRVVRTFTDKLGITWTVYENGTVFMGSAQPKAE